MKSRIPRWTGVMAAALLALGSHAALAQPAGPGHHGPHGRGGFDLERVIAEVKAQLNLNTQQQAMWDAAVAHSKTARQNARAAMDSVHAALAAELAKPEPNFATVAAQSDAAQANAQAARKQVRDEWLSLYSTFSPAQKAVVRDVVKARLDRMEAFREKMKEKFQQRQGAN